MQQRLDQERFDRVKLLIPHALDLLDDVFPIDPVVHLFAASQAPQQFGLLLTPQFRMSSTYRSLIA